MPILINYALSGNGKFSFPNHPSYHGFKAKNIYKDSVLSSGWHCFCHQGLNLLTVRTAHTLDHTQALENQGKEERADSQNLANQNLNTLLCHKPLSYVDGK